MDRPLYHLEGMGGLGDNLHQRAIIRSLMKTRPVLLGTSWPCVYHDLIEQGLRIYHRPIALRTQLKNAAREKGKFEPAPSPLHRLPKVHMIYQRQHVGSGTILKAMYACAGIPNEYENFDFTLPVPDSWHYSLFNNFTKAWPKLDKPVCVYRPLTVRPEYMGGAWRNANADDYAEIFASIRDNFFVVSVADLEENREWLVGPQLKADVTLHKGELRFEEMAALVQGAKLMYTSSGMGAILAPAVGTPCVSIQGGYHPSSWQADGARHAPWLGIDPMIPCDCASSGCNKNCAKRIDVSDAQNKVKSFVSANCGVSLCSENRPISEMFDLPPPQAQPSRPPVARPGRISHAQLLGQIQRRGVKA
jgi:hypothetical protein